MSEMGSIVDKARKIAETFIGEPGVSAVFIGGSIAQGTHWEYSDLELGLLVDEKLEHLPYFNVIDGLGVEIVQIKKPKVEALLGKYQESGDYSDVKSFPIQFYQSEIISDPSGIWAQFKEIYDKHLLSDSITAVFKTKELENADKWYDIAKLHIAEAKPKSALAALRLAVNNLMCGIYWHNKIRLRSMHRTVQLLHEQSPLIGGYKLYEVFTDIYGISGTESEMREKILAVKDDVYTICAARWGAAIPQFFGISATRQVEDGKGVNNIIFHYKWCVHICGQELIKAGHCDITDYEREHPRLHEFLGFGSITSESLEVLVARYENLRQGIAAT